MHVRGRMARRTVEDRNCEVGNGEISTELVLRTRNTPGWDPKRRRIRFNDEVEACCSCTRHSTCQTSKCRCNVARTSCVNCACFSQCSNLPIPPPFTMHGNLCGETSGPEDNTFAPPVGINQQSEPASIPLHHRTPVSGLVGPLEGPSESDLLALPPPSRTPR